MRFLNTSTYKLRDDGPPPSDRYAILSHRWGEEEITFATLDSDNLMNRSKDTPSLSKIRGACDKAFDQKIQWLWIDTCCINKANAVEEARSINSMFEWYNDAAVCYAYLPDVDIDLVGSAVSPQVFKSQHAERTGQWSEWFERGWTLQELLAPRNMEFYDRNWKFIGKKKDLASGLQQITGIGQEYLTSEDPMTKIQEASVAIRMSWMAGRTTGYIEDIAYSMLGMFGITMTPQYGEGKKAFMRLQKTLMEASEDESIFAWTVPERKELACFRKPHSHPPKFGPQTWGLVAPSPDCFKNSGDVVVIQNQVVPRLGGGYSWTQQGVLFQLALREAHTSFLGLPRKEMDLPLNCWKSGETVVLRLIKTNDKANYTYERDQCNDLRLRKGAKPGNNRVHGFNQVMTLPLTIKQPSLN